MAESHLDFVKSMYDERSEKYDENDVHVRQSQDYIQWTNLKKGESVLDLACGTGLVALQAKHEVGENGHVVGIDISEGMLKVARRKAEAAGFDVEFINHDISNLSDVVDRILPSGAVGFDVITCASALILLPDPLQAFINWKSLLRPGGRLITDTQTKDANVVMNIFQAIASKVDESVPWHSNLWQSQQALEKLAIDGGLSVERIFETEAYAKTQYDAGAAPELFEKAIEKAMFANFGRYEIRERAKDLFLKRYADIAGPAGSVDEETRFWVVVAIKSE